MASVAGRQPIPVSGRGVCHTARAIVIATLAPHSCPHDAWVGCPAIGAQADDFRRRSVPGSSCREKRCRLRFGHNRWWLGSVSIDGAPMRTTASERRARSDAVHICAWGARKARCGLPGCSGRLAWPKAAGLFAGAARRDPCESQGHGPRTCFSPFARLTRCAALCPNFRSTRARHLTEGFSFLRGQNVLAGPGGQVETREGKGSQDDSSCHHVADRFEWACA